MYNITVYDPDPRIFGLVEYPYGFTTHGYFNPSPSFRKWTEQLSEGIEYSKNLSAWNPFVIFSFKNENDYALFILTYYEKMNKEPVYYLVSI